MKKLSKKHSIQLVFAVSSLLTSVFIPNSVLAANNSDNYSAIELRQRSNQSSTDNKENSSDKIILSQPLESPLTGNSTNSISLVFDETKYDTKTSQLGNQTITYRAFENIPYVSNPIDVNEQYINIYVPEAYFQNGTINGYNSKTAPIFMPNQVGGYMPSKASVPGMDSEGNPNALLVALVRGYVVASPATRGRTDQNENGDYIGKAPAVIVDLQAATAYLHANDECMPGNADRIITNGTSAGGAVSLLQGAAGNHIDYQPYLQAIGAANARTDVFAVSAYAPITNLDAADMAYEWSYNSVHEFDKVSMNRGELPIAAMGAMDSMSKDVVPQIPSGAIKTDINSQSDNNKKTNVEHIILTEGDKAYSDILKKEFTNYVNSLQLHDDKGILLTLDKDGNGTFKTYIKSFIIDALEHARISGTDISSHTYAIIDNVTGEVKDIDWEAYNNFVSRMKTPGAFDSRNNDTGENNLFGTMNTDNNHFTRISASYDTTDAKNVYMANQKIVNMMNPMYYIDNTNATVAKYYRIRYGTADNNTSVAIPFIFGTKAKNLGYQVDMATPFNVDHRGDYDLTELFEWIDSIVKNSYQLKG